MKQKRQSFYSVATLVVPGILLVITNNSNHGVSAQSSRSCPVCANDQALRFPDESICQALSPRTSGMFETDKECLDLQMEAYQIGCCPLPPFDHCGYCADGTPANMDAIVPTGQYVNGENCFDYSYRPESRIGIFEDGSCADTFLQRAGHYCGCPQQKQECWLCPDKLPPGKPGRGDDWVTGSNCRGIEFLFSLFKEDECGTFPMSAGADLAIFCGCGGLNQTEIEEHKELFECELCRNGGVLVDPNLIYTDGSTSFSKTCGKADEFARDVIKTPYGCNNPNYFGKAREVCCSNGQVSGARPISALSVLAVSFAVSQVVAMALAAVL